MQHLKPTAKRRRKHHTAPKKVHRRRRRKGLSEGLSAGFAGALSPIMMGIFGGLTGVIVNSFFPKLSPVAKIAVGAVGAGILIKTAKAPNFGAGFAAGMTMPAIAAFLQPAGQSMQEGYLTEDLPDIIDDGEGLSAGYLSETILSESEFDGLEA